MHANGPADHTYKTLALHQVAAPWDSSALLSLALHVLPLTYLPAVLLH